MVLVQRGRGFFKLMEVKFQYRFAYNSEIGKIYRPQAEVFLTSPKTDLQANTWMIIDSGADHSILPKFLAEKLGISLNTECDSQETSGVGGKQIIYFYPKKLKIKIGEANLSVPFWFFDNNNVPPLLGRYGFLDEVDVCFKNREVIFNF